MKKTILAVGIAAALPWSAAARAVTDIDALRAEFIRNSRPCKATTRRG